MQKQYKKQYQLFCLGTRKVNDQFELIITENVDENYGRYYASNDIFDTEDKALKHALTHEDYKWSKFIILPFYERCND